MTKRQIDKLDLIASLRLGVLVIENQIEQNKAAGLSVNSAVQQDLYTARRHLLRLQQNAKTIKARRGGLAGKYFR